MSAVLHESTQLAAANRELAQRDAHGRIEWSLEHFPAQHVLSSSFGIQAALMLHLINEVAPGLPVIFIDTGYHFAATYTFVDQLSERLSLNLQVYRSPLSAAWQEARHGQRWQQGRAAIEAYNQDSKVAPMQAALKELHVGTWFSGVRRSQSASRAELDFVTRQWQRFKVHPVADWSDQQVHRYLVAHDLPYHPLHDEGYISIGDWHTTRSLKDISSAEEARFFGLMRECGLHENTDPSVSTDK